MKITIDGRTFEDFGDASTNLIAPTRSGYEVKVRASGDLSRFYDAFHEKIAAMAADFARHFDATVESEVLRLLDAGVAVTHLEDKVDGLRSCRVMSGEEELSRVYVKQDDADPLVLTIRIDRALTPRC